MIGDVGFEKVGDSLEDIVAQECRMQLIDVFRGGCVIFRFQSPATTMVNWCACVSEKVRFFDFHDHPAMITLDSEVEGFIANGRFRCQFWFSKNEVDPFGSSKMSCEFIQWVMVGKQVNQAKFQAELGWCLSCSWFVEISHDGNDAVWVSGFVCLDEVLEVS